MHTTQRMKPATTAVLVLVLTAVFASGAVHAAENATQSGCQICASTGDCSRAYRGEAGQFCGNWLDRSNTRQPCCCPTNAVCKVTNYACNCAYANTGRDRYGRDGGGYYDGGGYALAWLWWLLGSLLLLLCCCSCCYAMFRRRNAMESPVAYPVAEPAPPMYGAPSSTPTAPMYTTQPAYGAPAYGAPGYGGGYMGGSAPYAGRSGMSAGAGAALGGGAGLLGGLLLGEAIADAGRGDYGGGGYDGDGGGGYDGGGGGDFGGDF